MARRDRKVEAAEALKITAPDLLALGSIDGIVPEPLGGAHKDPDARRALVDQALTQALAELTPLRSRSGSPRRYDKFRHMGREGQRVRRHRRAARRRRDSRQDRVA